MNVRVEQADACRRVLHIELPAETLTAEYAAVLQEYSRAAQIPGFRRGKVPRELVARRFAKEIAQDVRDRVVPRSYREAIRQEKLNPAAIVNFQPPEILFEQPYRFDVVVDVWPDFTLPEYRGIPLKRQNSAVTEEQIDGQIAELRTRGGKFGEVQERGIRAGDFVQLDFTGVAEGQPVAALAGKEGAGLGEGKDFWLLLGEHELLPGMAAGLAGAQVGETRVVEVAFPADFRVPALAGKKAQYTVGVKQIRERILAELNEDFFKELKVASEAELRAGIRKDLEILQEVAQRRRLRNEALRYLLEQTAIAGLPQSAVDRQTRLALEEIVRDNVRRGVTREELEGHKDEIYDNAVKTSADRVKLDCILSRIAEQERIQVSEAELTAEIEFLARRNEMPVARLREELTRREALEGLRDDVRAAKTTDFLLQQAKIEEQGSV
jgi:trigger factor